MVFKRPLKFDQMVAQQPKTARASGVVPPVVQAGVKSINTKKVAVSSKYLDIPDYIIHVVDGQLEASHVVYHIHVIGLAQKMVYKRYREFWDFHEQFVEPLGVGIDVPPKHLLAFGQDTAFIETRKKELDSYIQKLLKHSQVFLHPKFVEFFEIGTMENPEQLRNRELKEFKKVLIQNEKAHMTPLPLAKARSKSFGNISNKVTPSKDDLRTHRKEHSTGRVGHVLPTPGWGM